MDKNNFVFEPNTSGIDKSKITVGYGTIDCNYEKAWQDLLEDSAVAEILPNTEEGKISMVSIPNSNIVYLPDFPSSILDYETMSSDNRYGKDKYYWDARGQRLYKFLVNTPDDDTVNPDARPFVENQQKIIGVDGEPAYLVDTYITFSKLIGEFKKIPVPKITGDTIALDGTPEAKAPMPYREDVYYLDSTTGQYYVFISNYTANVNNWYYDNTLEVSTLKKYIIKDNTQLSGWSDVASVVVCEDDPNILYPIVDGEVEETYEEPEDEPTEEEQEEIGETEEPEDEPTEEPEEEDEEPAKQDIDEFDKEIYYCNKNTNTLYSFDYGQFFKKVVYTGTVYENPFNFYRRMQDVFLDVYLNATTNIGSKIPTKKIFYIKGHPSICVSSPDEERYYYDTKAQKYYEYISSTDSWSEIEQQCLLVPQTYFPHTHGNIQKGLSLEDFDITDCYTKKEVDRLMPSIPGYISAFNNDMNYFNQHQDISIKQDLLTAKQTEAVNSGVTLNRVHNWNQCKIVSDNKLPLLNDEQIKACNSGVTESLVEYWDSLEQIIDSKATKYNTLSGYGITDAYTDAELASYINVLVDMLNAG